MPKSTSECFYLSSLSKLRAGNSRTVMSAGVWRVLFLACAALSATTARSSAGATEIPTDVRLLITGTNQASVMWVDTSTGETGFDIQRRTGDTGAGWAIVQSPAANATSWTDTAVPANNHVSYRVRSKNGASVSAWSNVAILTNPGDSDADGIPDTAETATGLDPSDWKDATADMDGDGVPNAWEYALGTDMTDVASKPTPHVTVDSTAASESDTLKRTITAALNSPALPASNSTTPPYCVIVVLPGVYEGNLNLPTGRKIALLSDGSGAPPEIRGFGTGGSELQCVDVAGDAVLDGFRISRKAGQDGSGLRVSTSTSRRMTRVVNCFVHENVSAAGAGIEQKNGRLVVAHTSVYGNTKTGGAGAGLYGSPSSTFADPQAYSINSIYWNPASGTVAEISHSAPATFVNCIIRNGSAWGAITSDPLLNPRGYLLSGSPAIDAGASGHGAPWDVDIELRDANPDIGADEFVDVDADAIPDHFESGGNLLPNNDDDGDGLQNLAEYQTHGTNSILADSDDDGLNDGDEIAEGTNPFSPDSDDDGMSDGYEHLHGLDPLSLWDRLGDIDGDRVPNFWEFKKGTSPSDPGSKPVADYIVSPSLAGTGNYKATIQGAIDAVGNTHGIIEVRPGTYVENVVVVNKKILLLGDRGAVPVEIRAPADSFALRLAGESVVDGFRLCRGTDFNSLTYSGVSVEIDYNASSTPREQAKLINCLVHGHKAATGAGVYLENGRLTVTHCTVFGNDATNQGNGIAMFGTSTAALKVSNSIIWNSTGAAATELYRTAALATIDVTNSIVRGGAFGGINSNPVLNIHGFVTASSPAIDAGAPTEALKDVQGETRSGTPDLGADEFIDGDGDALPDWVEALGATSAPGDYDSDGLSSQDEYELYATNPALADTDADGLNDGGEIAAGANPHDADSDDDSMTDGFEVTHALDPLNWRDALEDKDGDRIPNVYEWANGTDASNAASYPTPHFTIDPAATQTATVKNAIMTAVNASGSDTYRIIFVKSAIYDQTVTNSTKPILLLGEQGANAPTIKRAGNFYCISLTKRHSVIDGFVLTHTPESVERAVAITTGEPEADSRLVNCVVIGNTADYGAGLFVSLGEVIVDHCTFVGNQSTAYYGGNAGIQLASPAKLRLRNSIVWNPSTAPGTTQIAQTTSGSVSTSNAIVLGAEHGASGADPRFAFQSAMLLSSSPAIDGATAISGSIINKDIHGETRDASPDIGADEFVDSDADDLADVWEQQYHGGLTSSTNDDPDGDGIGNAHEIALGFNPSDDDTDGNGVLDWYQVLAIANLFYTTSTDLADDDSDGLTNAQEMLIGSNPLVADSNGDGIRDGASWKLRIRPTSTDSDGDGISNSMELAQGINPLLADTDRDGVADGLDAFPLDPGASTLSSVPGDTTSPAIILTKPPGAVLIP